MENKPIIYVVDDEKSILDFFKVFFNLKFKDNIESKIYSVSEELFLEYKADFNKYSMDSSDTYGLNQIVITDTELLNDSHMQGYDLIDAIRNEQNGPDTYIIGMSADVSLASKMEKSDIFLSKPLEISELKDILENVISMYDDGLILE